MQTLGEDAHLYSLRDALLYNPNFGTQPAGAAGIGAMSGNWTAANPPFGAVFTYSVRQDLPGDTKLVLTIADEAGKQVRRLDLDKSAGLRRVAWNLRTDPPPPQDQGGRGRTGEPGVAGAAPIGGGRGQQPPLVPAGRYHATLGLMKGPDVTPTGSPRAFQVVPLER